MTSQASTYEVPDDFNDILRHIASIAEEAFRWVKAALSSIADSIVAALEFLKEHMVWISAVVSYLFAEIATFLAVSGCFVVPDADAWGETRHKQRKRLPPRPKNAPGSRALPSTSESLSSFVLNELQLEIHNQTSELERLVVEVDSSRSRAEHFQELAALNEAIARANMLELAAHISAELQAHSRKDQTRPWILALLISLALMLLKGFFEALYELWIQTGPLSALFFGS